MGGVLAMVVLDETAVGVALPTIAHDLGMSTTTSHWVFNAYLLTLTGLAAAAGKALDIVGVKRLVLVGVAIFGLASITCGLAPNTSVLIAARAVQGIGAAIIFPASVVMISAVFPPAQRGTAFGVQVTVGAVALSSGPLIGGVLTQWLGWRTIFWVNIPVALAILAIVTTAWRDVPRTGPSPRLDVAGAAVFLLGLFALVLAIMQGSDWGWSSPTIIVLLCGGALTLTGFVWHELRTKSPLLELRLFRNPTFAAANVIVFTSYFGKLMITVLGALYLQKTVGLSPTMAGAVLLGAIAPTLVTALLSGRMADRFGPRRPILAGTACSIAGMLWVSLTVSSEHVALMMPGLVLCGAALPFMNVPPRQAAMNAVEPNLHGQAGGINLSAQLLGGTVGVAIGSAVLRATNDYLLIFMMPAALMLATFVLSWRMLDRPARGTGEGAARGTA